MKHLKYTPYPPSMDEWAGYWENESKTIIAYKSRNGAIHLWMQRDATGAVVGDPIILSPS
jgi:hypothetical protein